MGREYGDITRAFARVGLLSFGGPAAQIGLMSREFVEKRGWITEADFLSALSFCMLLPGPEAMQLATYIGWRRAGVWGGVIAGGLFVLPGAIVIMILAALYAQFGQVPLAAALFAGVQAACLAIVFQALLRLGRRALVSYWQRAMALAAFCGIFALQLPFPFVLLGAGLAGAVFLRQDRGGPGASVPRAAALRASLGAALMWLALWLVPLALIWGFAPQIIADIALFFSKLALLTFGGAYAVLAWMAQEVVTAQAWLSPGQMLDALALAETTPGPLILVTQFVAFLAGYQQGGVWLGLAGAGAALWVTFVPSFCMVFAGAPWMGHLQNAPRLGAALSGVMAAVFGVIAQLALWFALHVLFESLTVYHIGPAQILLPEWHSLRALPPVLAVLAGVLLLRLRWALPAVLAVCAGLSGGYALIVDEI